MAQLAVIGAGNMAEAILRGVIEQRLFPPGEIIATDVRPQQLLRLAETLGITTMTSNAQAVAAAPLVLLAVKPQNLDEVGAELAASLTECHVVISILAGKPAQAVREALGGKAAVVRVMPNLPALVGAGASALAATQDTPQQALAMAEKILATVGAVVRVDESLMDAVTAVSGSGPGYLFLFMEAMIQAGVDLGLSVETANTLVLHTFAGAGRLALEGEDDVVTLRQKVSSPGGTTLAGLEVFEADGLREMMKRATAKACERAAQLGATR